MDNPREHAHPSTKEYTKARPWRESPKLSSIPEMDVDKAPFC